MAWLTDILERVVSGRTKAHELDTLRIHPPKTADQRRFRADGLRDHFLARLCTA